MTPKLRFSKNDTRESALAKAAIWYDNIADDKVATFATAIGGQADMSCETMMAAIEQGWLMAAEGRAAFLAEVAEALDEVLAGCEQRNSHASAQSCRPALDFAGGATTRFRTDVANRRALTPPSGLEPQGRPRFLTTEY